MKFASIDIGTNTLRLLIATEDKFSQGLNPKGYKRVITRLGGGYTDEVGISPDAAKRSLDALRDFKSIMNDHGVKKVTAVATSVVRRAKNGSEFIASVKAETGIEIEVIDGVDEAGLTFFGVMFVVEDRWDNSITRLIFDIGGGSTEFSVAKGLDIEKSWSMELGVVELTEKFLKSDPPTPEELGAMREHISKNISELKSLMKDSSIDTEKLSSDAGVFLMGTAGTITTLASVSMRLKEYNPNFINKCTLSKKKISDIYDRLSAMTIAERSEVVGLEKGREDLIIAGTAIVLEVMDSFCFDDLKVSDGGLLEGVMLKQMWESRAGE
ncbi:MAG: Ppx/GppA family phosphatase [Deltaproteobacteria bacterium]|nr:Ppx/GppA family phosphatase [Deltaproteobacteria bacterium]